MSGRLGARRLVVLLSGAGLLLIGAKGGDGEHFRGSSPLDAEEAKLVTVPGAVDPHGHPDHCGECHGGADVTLSPPPMAACERCHPMTNIHLVGVAPEEVAVPAAMLLEDGQVACVTCHDEPACGGEDRDVRGPRHFRNGPYATTLDLCFSCHQRTSYQRTDPHRDLRTPDGARNDAVCVFCHQGVPCTEEDSKVEALRVDPLALCKSCHTQQIHVGIPSHLVIASPEVASRIKEYNLENEYPIPLGPGDEIHCTSCHDPHPGLDPLPIGVSPAKLAAMRESNRAYRDDYSLPRLRAELEGIVDDAGNQLRLEDGPRSKGGLLRIPADDGSLCLICHDLDGGSD
jgi:hypothetical protein